MSGEQLQRLLLGRHAVTGAALVPARGSAGRARQGVHPASPDFAGVPQMLTLAQAARVAGVSPTYLRRLAENTALTASIDHPSEAVHPVRDVADGETQPGIDLPATPEGAQDYLGAFRDPQQGRRWLVDKQELARFMTERLPPTVVIGYDLTCSAPKSVSLLWAFGDLQLRADITAALEAGVDAALAYLEMYGVAGTVAGKNRPGSGLAVASYRHEISRSEEAHLHVHNIIVNAVPIPVLDETGQPVLDADGVGVVEWRTLDSEVLLRHVRTAGFMGAAALRHELSRRRGLEWAPVRNGVAELAAFPRGLLEAFSTRTGEVHEEFAQLVDAGFTPDLATKNAAQRGSRAAKRVLSDPQVEALQRDKLTAAGWSVDQVQALGAAHVRELPAPSKAEVAGLFERLAGPGGLAEQQPLFTQREVHQQIAAWAVDRLAPDQIAGLAQRFLGDPRIVSVAAKGKRRRNSHEDTYTTSELLHTEDSLMALYRQGRTDHAATPRAVVDTALVEEAIAAVSQQLRAQSGDPGAALSPEQGDLVRALLSSGDLVRLVVGPAGTGKTEAMRAITGALTAAGHTVYGTANGGRQAQELTERIGITSQVVTSWLTRLDHVADPTTVWRPGTVLILDEATQVSTRDAERLLRYATRTGTAVILIGDLAQLGSVGAGGWFAHLVRTAGPDHVRGLSINQRQTGPRLATVREALELLRASDPAADQQALQKLADDGRLQVFTTREEMLAAIVRDWHTERQQPTNPGAATAGASPISPPGSPTSSPQSSPQGSPGAAGGLGMTASDLAGRSRMTAEHHRDAELLNRAVRARLAADGALSGPALHVAGRAFQAGDEVITLTQAGHTLVPIGRPAADYIRTGTIGIVTAVHTHHLDETDQPDQRHQLHHPHQGRQEGLTVLFPGHGEVHVGWDYLTHAFPDGRDGGLGHAYALTAHKAEGSTMPTARPALADDTSRAGLYVMLSRAKHDLRGYLIHRPTLDANLDDEDWLPVITDTDPAIRSLLDHLAASRPERLAGEHDAVARAAHQLSLAATLPQLTQARRARQGGSSGPELAGASTARTSGSDRSSSRPDAQAGEASALVVRRAELAAERRIGQAAIAEPSPDLIARIGPRPAAGPHLAVWEQAVRSLAVFHHRYQPHLPDDLPAHQLPAAPPDVPDDPEQAWARGRAEAERITERWAAALPPAQQRRFHTQQEAIPRQRATAGIHALLDAGWTPSDLTTALTQNPLSDDDEPRTADIRAGGPVLDHRVQRLLDHAGVDPGLHHLPAPAGPEQEWQHAAELLAAAEARHLATRPTAHLAGEYHRLTRLLTSPRLDARLGPLDPMPTLDAPVDRDDVFDGGLTIEDARSQWEEAQAQVRQAAAVCGAARQALTALQRQRQPAPGVLRTIHDRHTVRRQQLADAELHADTAASYLAAAEGDPTALTHLRTRLHRIDAALGHQIDDAAARLTQQPAGYLIGLLGHPPTDPNAAHQWRRRAVAVEHYRHYELGLPYGTPADATAPAVHQAIGPAPQTADLRGRYDQLHDAQPILDLGVAL